MIKSLLKKFIKPPIQMVRRHRDRAALANLTTHDSLELRAVGSAVQECIANKLSDEEKELIAAIEQRRSSLLKSDDKISVIDFGAGKSEDNRTRAEMERGVQSIALVSDICKASKPAFWATLLLKLIRKLEPSSCVELGSCFGISAAYQAAALSINGKGSLITLEGSPEIARIAEETLKHLNLENATVVTGPFHETLIGVLGSADPIDFFFNDGHHDHDAVIEYFNEAYPYLSDTAVIVFDDISWSPGMRKAWTEIEEDSRIAASIDLHAIGIAIVGKGCSAKAKFRMRL